LLLLKNPFVIYWTFCCIEFRKEGMRWIKNRFRYIENFVKTVFVITSFNQCYFQQTLITNHIRVPVCVLRILDWHDKALNQNRNIVPSACRCCFSMNRMFCYNTVSILMRNTTISNFCVCPTLFWYWFTCLRHTSWNNNTFVLRISIAIDIVRHDSWTYVRSITNVTFCSSRQVAFLWWGMNQKLYSWMNRIITKSSIISLVIGG
jgi:hypothetical protein